MKPTIKRAIRFAQVSVLLSALPLSAHALQYTAVQLGTLGGTLNWVTGINDSGQVVGGSFITGGYLHAFISAPNPTGTGQLTDLGTLGGTHSTAFGINDSGQVVGYSQTTGDAAVHAFISAPNGGALTDLGTLGGTWSFARGINDSGQVVGYSQTTGDAATHAFISAPNGGALTDLGTLGGTGSSAEGINNSGQVVGTAWTTGDTVWHAFISAPNPTGTGQLTDLGTLGGQYSWAYGINDSGQVVGRANTTGDAARHAFLYDAGIMMDLNDLLMVGLDGGAFLREATAINDSGQIVALGSDDFGYLLTPVAASVPEPSTAWLMVSALVGLGAASRRRV